MGIASRRTKGDAQILRTEISVGTHRQSNHAAAKRHTAEVAEPRSGRTSARNRVIAVRDILGQIDLGFHIRLHPHSSRRREHDVGRSGESDGYHAVVSVAAGGGVGHGEAGCACGACRGDGKDAGVGGVGYGCERCREAGGVAAGEGVDAVCDIAAGVDGERQVGGHAQIVGSGEDDV